MTHTFHPRVSRFTRSTAALAIASLSFTSLAQASQAESSAPQPAATSAPPKAPDKRQVEAARDAYLNGARLLDRRDLSGAETQFSKALKLNPANPDYATALALAREHHITELVQQAGKARILGQNTKADTLLAEARLLDPQNTIVTQHIDPGAIPTTFNPQIEPWIRESPSLAGPVTLLPNSSRQSFHLHTDSQEAVRQVMSRYGIRAVFEDTVPRQSLRFDLEDTPYQQAVPILLRMAGLFAVPLDSGSVIIATDTTENRQRLERQLQETIYVPGMTIEQMGELGNVVRNVFDIKQLTVQTNSGTLVIRAPEDILTAVNLTLADLIDGGSQVLIELKLYAVDQTRQREIGTQLPQQVGIYSVAGAAHDLVTANQSLVNQAISQGLIKPGSSDIIIALALIASGLVQSTLLSSTIGFFGGGITMTGLTLNQNPSFHLALNSSDTRSLDVIQVRVGDRQTANFRSGTRYPITTATYSSGITGNSSVPTGATINGVLVSSLLSQASSLTIPQIQYEDLGVTLKATPTVQKSGDITMHLDLKIEALAGGSANNIPILANRQFVSDVTVHDSETALLASTLTRSESAAVGGIPGLGELPGFQTATADKVAETDSSELILLITPHVVRRRSSITVGPRIPVSLPQTPD